MSTDSPEEGRAFEAPDLLEVMEEAVVYSRFLVDTVSRWAEGTSKLLDFGAGNGRFAGAVHERGYEVWAVEPDPVLREAIAARGVTARESLEALGGERFDGIYSLNVLEHVEDDRGLLRAFFERLEPGGRMLAYVPAFPVLYSANDARVGHLRRYRLRGLADAVRAAGFRVERARYVDCLGFPAGLWYRWFGNADGGLDVGAVKLYDRVVFPVSRVFDRLAGPFVGKNLLLTAVRPRA